MLTIVKKWCQVHVGVGLGITRHMLTIVNPTRHMLTIVNAKLTCAAMRPQVNNSWHVLTCGDDVARLDRTMICKRGLILPPGSISA